MKTAKDRGHEAALRLDCALDKPIKDEGRGGTVLRGRNSHQEVSNQV